MRALVLLLVAASVGLAGCETLRPKVAVHDPVTVQPEPRAAAAAPTHGAIFSVANHRPLFEDRRARLAGDILTVVIEEKTSASTRSDAKVERSASVEASISALPLAALSPATLAKADAEGASSNELDSQGQTSSNNAFSGTIAVSVVDVLANGNLVVAGEKQVGINHSVEVMRFSGIVDPTTIRAGNRVSSTQVADARLEYRGRGDIDRALTFGWLARFFLSFLPI